MKNIHLLPTDKPTRLAIQLDCKPKYNLQVSETEKNNWTINWEKQHLYITSDEEIKEGDWFIANQGVHKCIEVRENNDYPFGTIDNLGYELYHSKNWNTKVIITTDPELIADDVQGIDDEFLQWYVKNPTCEYVEIADDTLTVDEMSKLPLGSRNHKYKIIISQEESKQECKGSVLEQLRNHFVPREELKPTYEEIRKIADEIWNEQHDLIKDKNVIPEKYAARQMLMMNAHEVIDTRVHKEETLEEAAERLITNPTLEDKLVFEEGANWQTERMYSHTEVLAILEQFIEHPTKPGYKRSDVVEFIKQFKEKKDAR